MVTTRKAAETFSPGEYIRDELEARGWTQSDLAEIMGRPIPMVNEITNGKRAITLKTAQGLGEAFETGPEFWINLQSIYTAGQANRPATAIAKRASLYSIAPVREMIRRGWIEEPNNVDALAESLKSFFEVDSLDEELPLVPHAARKSVSYGVVTPELRAWLHRAYKLAQNITAGVFSNSGLDEVFERLSRIRHAAEETRHVSRILNDAGIRFVVLQHLARTRIDGTCLWLNEKSPVVVISLRYDRLDWFWFTLLHELQHVKARDGLGESNQPLDVDLVGRKAIKTEEKPASEQYADRFAEDFLVPKTELDDFIARVRPLYSKERITDFARRIGVHPALVVGQLMNREEISYTHSREMLEKVKRIIVPSTLTDGWGNSVQTQERLGRKK